jgi:hypothetical protein
MYFKLCKINATYNQYLFMMIYDAYILCNKFYGSYPVWINTLLTVTTVVRQYSPFINCALVLVQCARSICQRCQRRPKGWGPSRALRQKCCKGGGPSRALRQKFCKGVTWGPSRALRQKCCKGVRPQPSSASKVLQRGEAPAELCIKSVAKEWFPRWALRQKCCKGVRP